MEHIVQFAIGIDDEAIKKRIAESAENQIVASIKEDVESIMFNKEYYGTSRINKGSPKSWVEDLVKEVIEANKDQIIKGATEELARNMAKTKLVREAIKEAVEE